MWHYLGTEAKAAHDAPQIRGNAWGEGLRALLNPAFRPETRPDEALAIWQRQADAGDIKSARAGCQFGSVFRAGLRAMGGRKGDRTWHPPLRVRYCAMVPGDWGKGRSASRPGPTARWALG